MTINNTPSQSTPAVSVVIPMYNVEKYIGECLDSLLYQTFQDFEVIIVNDCSTDNSRAIAESYVDKFNGRLKIFDNEKNSGPSDTRNNGLRRATGEYVFFMDSDDLLLAYGLEELYTFAKDYQVDFINCTANYDMSDDGKELIFKRYLVKFVPSIMIETSMQRIANLLILRKINWAPWRKFFKRNFLIENELFFPENIRIAEDRICSYAIFLCAKKILQLPKPYVLYRQNKKSLSRSKKTRTAMENVMLSLTPLIYGMKWVDNIMNGVEFFKQEPQIRFAVLEGLITMFFEKNFKYYVKLKSNDIYTAIKQEFGEICGDHDILIAQLFTYLDTLNKRNAKLEQQFSDSQQRIAELEQQLKIAKENSYDIYQPPPTVKLRCIRYYPNVQRGKIYRRNS